ncbi:FAD-dependent oxidoreductase [Pseudovibrio exalbescens]|uniref:NAD(P)/FAD-dependent oxidoreductase n=1 Tax=Pseudovibrio exalbescens TaxID=197461 RepID=UPI002367131B|nr:FAD-dependent oxidoreductase [Pseudovibrio exalbescens]MDD7909359.1 FAD-dependent oxidoreductase [Pseudovibrio exalbescens]
MKAFDIAIVGAGIFGLSVAKAACDHGLSVVLIEKNTVASGASHGLLGALMPHIPSQWNDKKQFQFEALKTLSDGIAQLEDATGLSTGYRRVGRLMPLYTQDKLDHALHRQEESKTRWATAETGFSFSVLDASPHAGWPAAAAAPLGFIWDTLAARANPRLVSAALKAYLQPRITLMEHTEFKSFDEATGKLTLSSAEPVSAGHLVLSAGYEGFDLIEDLTGQHIGSGVKGQSLSLKLDLPHDLPVIYDDGIYVIAHENGSVAVGSTSEREWQDTKTEEDTLQGMLNKAIAFCPVLKDAPIIDRWAGIRPKCRKRDPLVGQMPTHEKIWIATGGFKISYGIAHRIADALMQQLGVTSAKDIHIPQTFRPESHFKW